MTSGNRTSAQRRAAAGVFLLAFAVYSLSAPGRIDTVDGQFRFEVARHLVTDGRPILTDPGMAAVYGWNDGRGSYVAYYAAGRTLPALPLVAVGIWLGDPLQQLAAFFFTLASPLFSALLLALLFGFYLSLGVATGPALGWTAVTGFATLLWPTAASAFDQPQHAFFALSALFLAHQSARRSSRGLSALAGLVAGTLFLFQESYGFLILGLGLATLAVPPSRRRLPAGLDRLAIFGTAAALGLLAWWAYQPQDLGNPLLRGKWDPGASLAANPLTGNPVVGLLSLTLSPGKSVFLFSPPLLLALAGLPRLFRTQRWLGAAVAAAAALHLGLISSLSIYAGDWCWGPRYLVVLHPLLALAFPFIPAWAGRGWKMALVSAGVAVQLLGLSLEYHRFFFARALREEFWRDDRWYYFHHSQLLARPGELAAALHGLPPEATRFSPNPYPELPAYVIGGLPRKERHQPEAWMRRYAVFHLPRPWPLWMPGRPAEEQPVNPLEALVPLLLCGAAGAALLVGSRREAKEDEDRPPG